MLAAAPRGFEGRADQIHRGRARGSSAAPWTSVSRAWQVGRLKLDQRIFEEGTLVSMSCTVYAHRRRRRPPACMVHSRLDHEWARELGRSAAREWSGLGSRGYSVGGVAKTAGCSLTAGCMHIWGPSPLVLLHGVGLGFQSYRSLAPLHVHGVRSARDGCTDSVRACTPLERTSAKAKVPRLAA